MIPTAIKLFINALFWVYALDYSGFIEEMNTLLSRYYKMPIRIPKPFSCSLCMSLWTGVIILLGDLTWVNFLWLILASISTVVLYDLILFVVEFLQQCIWTLRKFTGTN